MASPFPVFAKAKDRHTQTVFRRFLFLLLRLGFELQGIIRDKLHLEWGDRFAWPDKDAECMGDDVFCYGLGDHFGILSDGRIVPCCLDADGEITLGNAFEDKIEDIIASDRAKSIREGFKTRHAPEPLCQRCGYARRFK